MAIKKGKKKQVGLKKDAPNRFLELTELVKCWLLDLKVIEGSKLLIYQRLADSTIHGAWVHADTDLTYIKKTIKRQKKYKESCASWISIYKETLYNKPPVDNEISAIVVRHAAGSYEDMFDELNASKEDATKTIAKLKLEGKTMSTHEAVKRVVEGLL